MKISLIFFCLFLFIKGEITIDNCNNYIIDNNTINIAYSNNNYVCRLSGHTFNKSIILSNSISVTLDSLILISTGSLTPIIIEKNSEIKLNIRGNSYITDSPINENEGVIFMKEGSKLIIEGSILNINPNKKMAIKGEKDTSFCWKNGKINIFSTSSNAGGIYIDKEILFINGEFSYKAISGKNNVIETSGSIMIINGYYSINTESGKGIKAGDNIYIGIKNYDNNNYDNNYYYCNNNNY